MRKYLEWATKRRLVQELEVRQTGRNQYIVKRDVDLKTVFTGDDVEVVEFVSRNFGSEEVVIVNQSGQEVGRLSGRDINVRILP